jgi:hypothetical protein
MEKTVNHNPRRHKTTTTENEWHTHADQSSTVVKNDTLALQTVTAGSHNFRDTLVEGVAERDVCDHTSLEESPGAHALGAIDDLVGNDEIAGLDFLLQATDGREGDDGTDSNRAQSGDVGARWDLMRCNLVVSTVSAEESDGNGLLVVRALVVQDSDRRGGVAPGRGDRQRRNLSEAGELAQSSTTDDGDTHRLYIH